MAICSMAKEEEQRAPRPYDTVEVKLHLVLVPPFGCVKLASKPWLREACLKPSLCRLVTRNDTMPVISRDTQTTANNSAGSRCGCEDVCEGSVGLSPQLIPDRIP